MDESEIEMGSRLSNSESGDQSPNYQYMAAKNNISGFILFKHKLKLTLTKPFVLSLIAIPLILMSAKTVEEEGELLGVEGNCEGIA